MKKILVFSGSNSSKSINTALVKHIGNQITDASITFIDLNKYKAPMYDIDLEKVSGIPESMKQLMEKFNEHDGFIIASPEYNGFMPAFLKSILDWVSRLSNPLFQNKPLFLVSTSPGLRGGETNLKYMADAFQYRGATPIFRFSLPSFNDNFDSASAKISNEEQAKMLASISDQFVKSVNLKAD